MQPEFWHNKWHKNEIGFHEGEPNQYLTTYLPNLNLPSGATIFVPLCGKSIDIHYLLNMGFHVVGVELSPIAINALFHELGLTPKQLQQGKLIRHSADRLTVFEGDIFDLKQTDIGKVNATYDRAALVAFPLEMRQPYVEHIVDITRGAKQLLISLSYDQEVHPGPPFSVDAAQIIALYQQHYLPTLLNSSESELGLKGKWPMMELTWKLEG